MIKKTRDNETGADSFYYNYIDLRFLGSALLYNKNLHYSMTRR